MYQYHMTIRLYFRKKFLKKRTTQRQNIYTNNIEWLDLVVVYVMKLLS